MRKNYVSIYNSLSNRFLRKVEVIKWEMNHWLWTIRYKRKLKIILRYHG